MPHVFDNVKWSLGDALRETLQQGYGFTQEELDFILNYDLKYRLEQEGAEEDE